MITHSSTGCILISGDMTHTTVGSISGNVTATAGKEHRQVGSDVMALAGEVTITAQSGISNRLISAGQTAQSLGQAAGNTSDSRMQALAGAAAALNGYNTYNSLTDKAGNFSPKQAQDISVNISIGSSRSQSNSSSQSDTARASSIAAGNNVNITATGLKRRKISKAPAAFAKRASLA